MSFCFVIIIWLWTSENDILPGLKTIKKLARKVPTAFGAQQSDLLHSTSIIDWCLAIKHNKNSDFFFFFPLLVLHVISRKHQAETQVPRGIFRIKNVRSVFATRHMFWNLIFIHLSYMSNSSFKTLINCKMFWPKMVFGHFDPPIPLSASSIAIRDTLHIL